MTNLYGWRAEAAVSAVVLAVALAVGGCASAERSGTRNSDVITMETIQYSTASNVFQLIQSERPAWLRRRGAITMRTGEEGLEDTPIIVYVDSGRFGTLADLTSLSLQGITEVRRLSAADATQRYGTGHPRGAIVISTQP